MDFFLCVWFYGFYCVGVSLSLVGCEWVGYTIYIYIYIYCFRELNHIFNLTRLELFLC